MEDTEEKTGYRLVPATFLVFRGVEEITDATRRDIHRQIIRNIPETELYMVYHLCTGDMVTDRILLP